MHVLKRTSATSARTVVAARELNPLTFLGERLRVCGCSRVACRRVRVCECVRVRCGWTRQPDSRCGCVHSSASVIRVVAGVLRRCCDRRRGLLSIYRNEKPAGSLSSKKHIQPTTTTTRTHAATTVRSNRTRNDAHAHAVCAQQLSSVCVQCSRYCIWPVATGNATPLSVHVHTLWVGWVCVCVQAGMLALCDALAGKSY